MAWIRFDAAVLFDDFCFELSGEEFKAWSYLLLYVKASGARGSAQEIGSGRLAAMANVNIASVKSMLKKAGDRFKSENGRIYVKNWHKYQEDHRDKSAYPENTGDAISAINAATPHHTTVPHTTLQDSTHSVCDFEVLWKQYPRREDRKGAFRHFQASVKTDTDLINIRRALDNYLKCHRVKSGYIKNGSTWFNQWQDWLEPSEAMMKGYTSTGQILPSVPRRKKPEGNWREQVISCSNCGKEHKASEVCKMEAEK